MGDAADDADRKADEEREQRSEAETDDRRAEAEAEEERNLPAIPEQEAAIEKARQQPTSHPGAVLPSPQEWAATMQVARTIAATPFVPKDYRRQPEAVVAAILMGRELGIGPMEALRQITMIDGRPTLSAALMLSKMRENGVQILRSSVTDQEARIIAKRTDTGEEMEAVWTYAEAETVMRAGKKLVDGDNWKNYRQDMLWARCVGRLARRLGSDLLGGNLYSTEEVRDWDEGTSPATYESSNDGTSAYFDPANDIMDGGIKGGDDVPGRIFQSLMESDPSVDWPATIQNAIQGCFGVDDRKDIPEERGREFWIRLANAAAKLAAGKTGDFPPAGDGLVEAAFQWAFSLDHFDVVLAAEVAEVVAELDVDEQIARDLDERGEEELSAEEDEQLTVEDAEIEPVEESESAEDTPLADGSDIGFAGPDA